MVTFSTNQVAKKLGIATKTLSRYVAQEKVPAPQIMQVGGGVIHIWRAADIEALRKLLPKIKNGRKTRYQKNQSATGNRQSVKARPKAKKQPQPRAAVPHKKKK